MFRCLCLFLLCAVVSVRAQSVPVPDMAALLHCVAAGSRLCLSGPAADLVYSVYKARHPSQVPGSFAGAGSLDVDPMVLPVSGPSGSVCPASVDLYDPAYSIPAGGPPDADGLCPTARSRHHAFVGLVGFAALLASRPVPPLSARLPSYGYSGSGLLLR